MTNDPSTSSAGQPNTADHNSIFSFADPIPTGRLAIQASAGTGKTFVLAGLATRFVAEHGVAINQLLIVTFTRAATGELRSRVRKQMSDTAEALEAHLAGNPLPISPPNDVTTHLLHQADPRHLTRLRCAISDFDSATVTTIHGFAKQMLGSLGTLSGVDPDATLVDDTIDMTRQACADLIATRAAAGTDSRHLPTVESLAHATGKILSIPGMALIPDPDDDSVDIRSRTFARMAIEAASVVAQRRSAASTMSFDDVLVMLRRAVNDRPGADLVLDTLRRRFQVALIDEFQDTDPVQWDIFRRLFDHAAPGSALVLVGDPKQAIYSFRGADISTYLDATHPPKLAETPPQDHNKTSHHHTSEITNRSLSTNWRSDGAVLDTLETLFDNVTFGSESIAFTHVDPSPDHAPLRILGARASRLSAMSIRLAVGDDILRTPKTGAIQKDSARRAIFNNLVDHVGALLADATIPDPEDPAHHRPVTPSDIAVLTLRRKDAESIRNHLVEHGIPAVLARGSSVLESEAASNWRWLLHAMARPSDPGRARTFALSWFSGHSVDWVRNVNDEAVVDLQEMLQTWADTLTTHGMAMVLRQIRDDSGVTARVLAMTDGDRYITDLDHVGQLLHDAYLGGALSPAALTASLDTEPSNDIDTEADTDITSRRVESEADAIQIMTVWVAKGLEFPIVCAPTLWDVFSNTGHTIFHDRITRRKTFDIPSCMTGNWDKPPRAWPDRKTTKARRDAAAAEHAAEDLRLLYVALTRARHHTAVWWTHTAKTDKSALSKVLFARTDGLLDHHLFDSDSVALPPDSQLTDALGPLVDRANGNIEVLVHGTATPADRMWGRDEDATTLDPLQLATLRSPPDRSKRRWSFSTIVNRIDFHPDPHDNSLADGGAADEQATASTATGKSAIAAPPAPQAEHPHIPDIQVSPLASLTAGPAFGTLVHEILESVDFTSTTLPDNLAAAVHARSRFSPVDLRPLPSTGSSHGSRSADGPRLLTDGLVAAINSPLGPLFDNKCLRQIPRSDRIDEMSFEVLLGQGQSPPSDRLIGELVRDHLGASDPLSGWAADLAAGVFNVELAGHLTGSIDALLRVEGHHGVDRFVVVDYKSNRLHNPGITPRPGDYARASMAAAMAHHHYGLQALLYSVAVHRYLRWRVADYDPAVHFGGVAYLFVRGMAGPDVSTGDGHPDGVFSWDLPANLVVDLSDLLNGDPTNTRSTS